MTTYALDPLDTLFFRDARPYNQQEMALTETPSLFPPHPQTLVGSMREAIARGQGWQPRHGGESWPDALKTVLGDGADLGALRFTGPHLLWKGEELFAAPACLLRQEDRLLRLAPGRPRRTDLGPAVRLPEVQEGGEARGAKELERSFLTPRGLATLLNGGTPDLDDVVTASDLWSEEGRVGIMRDNRTRTTVKGALYTNRQIRFHRGLRLAMTLQGLPEGWSTSDLNAVGGEGRMAWFERMADLPAPPQPPALREEDGKARAMVVVLSPLDLGDVPPPGPGEALADLPGRVVSACLPRPVRIGGWDGLNRRPLAARPLIGAGSVFFLEVEASEAEALRARHGKAIGARQAWGHGRIAIGTY